MVSAGERYAVQIDEHDGGSRVKIIDRSRGGVVSERACGDQREAELYASTVNQHVGWLTEERFREYYGLEE